MLFLHRWRSLHLLRSRSLIVFVNVRHETVSDDVSDALRQFGQHGTGRLSFRASHPSLPNDGHVKAAAGPCKQKIGSP